MPWGWARRTWAAEVTPDLVTIGGLTVDNVIAADGTVGLAKAGGNGAYSAVGALFFAERVGLVSQGVASYPRAVIERLAAGGIDLAGVEWIEAKLNACHWFIYDAQGYREERMQSTPEELAAAGFPTDRLTPAEVAAWCDYLRARNRPGEISYSQFRVVNPIRPERVPDAFLKARGVHLAPCQPGVLVAMLDRFAGSGAVVTADPGWQLLALSFDDLSPILARLDAFLPSEVELDALLPGEAPASALAILARHCPGAVAVKLGPKGVLVHDRARGEAVAVPASPAQTLDPTGAGDAFCGGFLAGLVETGDPVMAARFGAVSASRIVEHFGADGAMPIDRTDARRRLAAFDRPEIPAR